MASILGSDFDFETLKHACDLDEETLIGALEKAEHVQLITEMPPSQTAISRFSFVHVLIPTTLRQSTIHIRRRQLHLRAAQAIETVHPEDFEVLAYHYSEAGEVDRARQYYLRAGDRAQQIAPGEASRFYQAALERWPDGDQVGRSDLLARLGYCLWVIDDVEGSLKCFQTAYDLFDRLGIHTKSGEMQRMMGRMYWQQANWTLALEHYYKALAILEQGPESFELARAIDSISQIMMLSHDNEKGILWGERALKMAKNLGTENVVVSALNNIGSSYAQNGEYEKGGTLLLESIQLALANGLPPDASRGYYNIGVMYQRQCRYKSAEETMKDLLIYSNKFYTKTYHHLALWRLMWISWYTGHWNVALNYRLQLGESSDALYLTWMKRILGMIDLDLGQGNEALNVLEESLPDAVRADDFQTTVPHWGQVARAYAALGQVEKMTDTIHQLLKFVSTRSFLSHESIMPLLIASQLITSHGSSPNPYTIHSCVLLLKRHDQQFQTEESAAALAEAQGCMLLAEKQVSESVEQFHQAASRWERIERRYDQARALGYLANALETLPDPKGMIATYHQALEIVSSLADQLDQEQRHAFLISPLVTMINKKIAAFPRSRLRSNLLQDANPLTDREVEVLKLVGQGLTNAQIAEQLYLSPLTVNAHLRSIFNKLDVTTRTAAVRHATELGLV